MRMVTLTGWQQPADALASIALGATHFDYSRFDDLDACFAALPEADVAIGWSLGGRILIDAIARSTLKPKALFLLASKYQCMSDGDFPHGMSREMMEATKKAFQNNPVAMLKQFQLLIARGDSHERQVARDLITPLPAVWPQAMFWLEYLEKFSCRNVDFRHFPHTVIMHGTQDSITPVTQARILHEALPGSELHIFEGAAHALHLHDKYKVINLINQTIKCIF